MAGKNFKSIGNVIYLIMGAFAIFLGVVDLVSKAFLEAGLPFSWGVLIIFLRFKERLESKLGSKKIKGIHFLLMMIVVAATLVELVYRLRKL